MLKAVINECRSLVQGTSTRTWMRESASNFVHHAQDWLDRSFLAVAFQTRIHHFWQTSHTWPRSLSARFEWRHPPNASNAGFPHRCKSSELVERSWKDLLSTHQCTYCRDTCERCSRLCHPVLNIDPVPIEMVGRREQESEEHRHRPYNNNLN